MRSILVTGGTGSFGRAFVRRLLKVKERGPSNFDRIIVFSRGEHAQADMAQHVGPDDRLRYFIGDVRDRDRLVRALRGVDVVVHAAALKRIEVGHYNPTEMVKTNVLGTMNVVEAAEINGVKKVVGISSDKAWQPVSAYGHSKALAESVLLGANNTRAHDGPHFGVVRYGNVAGSAGSIIPKWRGMIASDPNITLNITDPECTRFWMFMDEAIDLVLDRVQSVKSGGELAYPAWLPAYRVADLATALGARYTKVTGLPTWEKRHEGMAEHCTSDVARRMSVDELKVALRQVA